MRYKNVAALVLITTLLTGCTSFWSLTGGSGTRDGVSSSLVDYLYPKGEVPPDFSNTIPHLRLPLRVAIAFVPGSYRSHSFSEATKMQLLENVKQGFVDREYIEHIEVIPDTYLQSSRGIEGMQQVARLYGVDVMALVSYDQISVTEDKAASLLYWTIVGAYIVNGTSNEVQTFVDTAVFDVETARLLFRAPGANKTEDRSTAIDSNESLRKSGEQSFTTAMQEMSVNLDAELDRFRDRAMDNPEVARVEWKPSRGGGAFGGVSLLVLLLLQISRQHRRRKHRFEFFPAFG